MTDPSVRVVLAGALATSFPRNAFEGQIDLVVAHTDEELRSAVRDAVVLYSWQIPTIVPAETPRLRWIQLPSAGADHIRELPVWTSDIILTASQGIHTVPMSEHLFAMLLALNRQLPAILRAQEQHEWTHNRREAPLRMSELRGKTMGIVGWGKIGNGIAHLARAFGMRVVGTRWSVIVPRQAPRTDGGAYTDPPWLEAEDAPPDILYPSAQLHEVLTQSDVVVVLLPLTAETRHSISKAEFRAMKRGALFFNLGRGAVVDEDALISALQSGHLAGAGLDVFAQEPLPRPSPLWTMPNVIVSPHVGGMSDRTRDRGAWLFAVNLTRYLEGQELINQVHRDQGY